MEGRKVPCGWALGAMKAGGSQGLRNQPIMDGDQRPGAKVSARKTVEKQKVEI